jgi:hypothetical protein
MDPAQLEGIRELEQLRRLFVALRDDLDHSGMMDIVVSREDVPSVVLTLDKRFVSAPTLELLHTSGFTVVGKVTQVWPGPDQVVNLYRRSVLALVPSLAQSTAWGVFTLLATMSRSFDVKAMERSAREAVGLAAEQDATETTATSTRADAPAVESADADVASEATGNGGSSGAEQPGDDVVIGDDVAALYPVVTAPAYQILPLAICS